MPPRHAYWTILIDDQPTAFRAHDPEELLPTLNRLREKNETAVMKWFERGQLFESREAAREAGLGKGERRWEGPRPERPADRDARPPRQTDRPDRPRDKTWRPGGEHRDPRQKYKDAKKAKWTRFKEKIRERHEARPPRDPETFSPPHGDPLRERQKDRPTERFDDRETRGWRRDAPREDRDGAPSRPHGDKFRQPQPRTNWRPRDDDRRPDRPREPRFDSREQNRDQRPARRDQPRSDWSDRPPRRDDDRRDWRPKGPGAGAKSWDTRKKPFAAKPFGKKPAGAKPYGAKPSGPPRGKSAPSGGPSTTTSFRKKPFGAKPFGKKPYGGKWRNEDE